jgi:hypothetical protein
MTVIFLLAKRARVRQLEGYTLDETYCREVILLDHHINDGAELAEDLSEDNLSDHALGVSRNEAEVKLKAS